MRVKLQIDLHFETILLTVLLQLSFLTVIYFYSYPFTFAFDFSYVFSYQYSLLNMTFQSVLGALIGLKNKQRESFAIKPMNP